VSATIANGAGAQTATIAAGSYFHTAAGGVSSLISAFQSALNTATLPSPTTAATANAAIGYGTFTGGAGYLCQEASGSLASTFGSPASLTASSTPTYRNTGHTTGDYAVGFNSSADDFRGGTGDFNVTGTDDIVVAWIGKFTGTPSGGGEFLFVKGNSGAARWGIYAAGAAVFFEVVNSAGTYTSGVNVTTILGEWHVGIAAIDRTAGTVRAALRGLTSGTTVTGSSTAITANTSTNAHAFTVGGRNGSQAATNWLLSSFYIASGSNVATGIPANISTALANFANAINSTWTVSLDTSGGTGRVSIGWSGYATPTWSLSWTSTDLRDALGFTANIAGVTTTQTGTAQAKGLWFPDSPLNCDDHPSMAPEDTDLRSTESPTGVVLGLSGNVKYVHTNVRWDRVPVDRIREASATYENASLEVFFRDCITGLGGHAWFTRLSKMQVYWSNAGTDTLLGADHDDGDGTSGWGLTTISKFRDIAQPSQPGWVGQFNVRFPRLVSDG
jgi:hypothetical protein